MSKKRIDPTKESGYIGVVKAKAKPKVYIQHPFEIDYIRLRNAAMMGDLFTDESTKEDILRVYGI